MRILHFGILAFLGLAEALVAEDGQAQASFEYTEPLSNIPGSYVNFESGVNPEYYNRTVRFKRRPDYGVPVVHRKLGLSSPNEKIVYQTWMKREFGSFRDFLDHYVCLRRKRCKGRSDFQPYLSELKSENEFEQEQFLKALAEPEFTTTCEKIMEIYDKFFDEGYCFFESFKTTRKNIRSLYERITFENRSKLEEIIDLILWIDADIARYQNECK